MEVIREGIYPGMSGDLIARHLQLAFIRCSEICGRGRRFV
jgi:hypothetical protein